MVRSATRCWVAPLQALLLALTTLTIGFTPLQTSGAVTIKCAPPATPAASASATATAMPETSPAAFPADGGELIVFAAASLTDVFGQIKNELEVANPGLTITYNFAGSQVLVTQMEQGAPADVFASANLAQMNNARDKGLIEGEAPIFALNRLVIIVPKDNPAGIQTSADLAKDGVKLDLAQEDVPVGQYARQAICQMGQKATTYGEGFVDRVAANVVSEEDNVRAIVTKVSTGEADAGVVYATDVTGELADQVQTIEIPPPVNVVATYPIAAVKDGDVELAQAFIDYVLAPAGQAALEQFGFEPRP
ncbi:MAG: molybdate transport system substrate-binding protein [Thermomicrobiales bacterium]|jgi:molybdate transport system substrate-binding protein|nr:molybdate transport system substrate-binding protein [Thermomicrobiales bacterium]